MLSPIKCKKGAAHTARWILRDLDMIMRDRTKPDTASRLADLIQRETGLNLLLHAGRAVLNNWERGDLAGAVRLLADAMERVRA